MPRLKFGLIFLLILTAAMVTVFGGAALSGSTGMTDFDFRLLAPIFVLIWLAARLWAKRRK